MVCLKIEVSPHIREVVEITKSLTIGRAQNNNIVIPKKKVSPHHIKIYLSKNEYVVKDLKSKSGTFLNGKKIQEAVLVEEDLLHIGGTPVLFTHDIFSEPDLEVDLTEKDFEEYDKQKMLESKDILFYFPSDGEIMDQVCQFSSEKLDHFPDLDDTVSMSLGTALQEAIGNAQRHGHKYQTHLPIEFRLVKQEDRLMIRVTDRGNGFDHPSELKRSESITPLEAARKRYQQGGYGGLGIMLMKGCIHKMQYNRKGNQVTLTRFLGEAAERWEKKKGTPQMF